MNPRLSSLSLLLTGVALLTGCNRPPDTSPPQVRYGEQECDWCRMLVSDERFAAALVFERGREVTKLVFDDINCVYSYLSDHPLTEPYRVFTHDLETRAWLDTRAAHFITSEKLETPMASKIAAAATADGAASLLQRYPGERLTLDQIAERFTRSTAQASAHKGTAP